MRTDAAFLYSAPARRHQTPFLPPPLQQRSALKLEASSKLVSSPFSPRNMAPTKRSRKQGAPQAQQVTLNYCRSQVRPLTSTQRRKITDHDGGDAPEVEHDTATDNPRSEVLGTTEILEAILEHLPAKSLFSVQRVSKVFQATILGSTHIQHKMSLRIRNKAQYPWAARQCRLPEPEFEQVSGSDQDETGTKRRLLTPIDINPSLDHGSNQGGNVSLYMDKHGISKLTRRRRLTKQEVEQLSVTKGFLSDPHCAKVQVDLSFTLGVRLPTRIDVSSLVSSSELLKIEGIITKALNQRATIRVHWRGDGHVSHPRPLVHRVPQELLDELKQQTGLDVFFRLSDVSFFIFYAVAPTDEERAAVARLNEANS